MSSRSYRRVLYRVMLHRTYRSVRYRYWCCTELSEVSGTGIDVEPNLPKCPVQVLMSYRSYRSVRYGYWCRNELTEVSGTGIDVRTLPKCTVPILMYRPYRSIRYRYRLQYIYRRYIYRAYAVFHGGTCLGSTLYVCCSNGTLRIFNWKQNNNNNNKRSLELKKDK